jgi:hypothetical protein
LIKFLGSNKEKLELTIDKAHYQPGQNVMGKLVISTGNEINARNLRFIVEGLEETKATVTEPHEINDSVTYQSQTYNDSDIFFSTDLKQFLSQSTDPNLISETQNGIIIHKGITEVPFQFKLPDNILSTYHGTNASINYKIKVTIDRKLRNDIEKSIPFDVITIRNNDYSTFEAHSFDSTTDGLSLRVVLQKNIYNVGDIIKGTVLLENPKSNSITVNGIRVGLVGSELTIAKGRSETKIIEKLEKEIVNWYENEQSQFEMKIPGSVNKSYKGKLSQLNWAIIATADIFMHSDLKTICAIELV